MELRHLRYFVLVAEELHFGRAAERAGIAQPPLSQQIRSLEAELGIRLFNRTKRHVELTDAGRALLPEARDTLRQAARAEQAARDGASGTTGRLSIAFVGSLAFSFVPRFVREYRRRFPGIRLSLREMTSEQQRGSIVQGSVDLGLVRYPILDPEFESHLIYREPIQVAVNSDHLLAADRESVNIASLAGEPFVMFPRDYGPPFFDQVMSLCREAGFTPHIAQEAVHMSTIVSLVGAGLG
jgi:DNA-binding transcriptional LysR family regulator